MDNLQLRLYGGRKLESRDILKKLPHRYPFLFIDRVIDLEPKKRGRGIKNISLNEPFFQGHFPGEPIFPGVLMIEIIAQMGAIVSQGDEDGNAANVGYIGQVRNFKFMKMAVPGDQLTVEVSLEYPFDHFIEIDGKIMREKELIARGKLVVTSRNDNP